VRKVLAAGWIGAFVLAALAYPAAAVFDGMAADEHVLTAFHESKVVVNQAMFELDAPDPKGPDFPRKVMEIYGIPQDKPLRVLFVPEGRFTRPKELPTLRFILVDNVTRLKPLEAQTLYFLAKWVTGGAALGGIALLAVWLFLQRRRPVPAGEGT
jgi:hypothetical protein